MATSVDSYFDDCDIFSSSLTNSLEAKLKERREQWTTWLEREQQRCDETIEQHAQSLRQAQHRIDNTSQEILAYQVTSRLNLTSEGHTDDGNSNLQRELVEMKETLQTTREQLQQIKDQAEHEEERAQDSREVLSQVKETAQTTLFHLTKANRHFEWAGLDIERAPNDCVRYVNQECRTENRCSYSSFSHIVSLSFFSKQIQIYTLGPSGCLSSFLRTTRGQSEQRSLRDPRVRAISHFLGSPLGISKHSQPRRACQSHVRQL